jgi:hypothetical protein
MEEDELIPVTAEHQIKAVCSGGESNEPENSKCTTGRRPQGLALFWERKEKEVDARDNRVVLRDGRRSVHPFAHLGQRAWQPRGVAVVLKIAPRAGLC